MDEVKRKAFFGRISKALGRDTIPSEVTPFSFEKGPQNKMMQDMTREEIVTRFKEECDNVGTVYCDATPDTLKDVLLGVIEGYGGGKVIYPRTADVAAYGLKTAFEENQNASIHFSEWNAENGREANIVMTQDANIGITFPGMAIAETATIIQPSGVESGRSIGLLPITHVAIVRTDSIVPRMTQSMAMMSKVYQAHPEEFPSNIVHISGPSNTADIELVRVVGVHGPINVTFILLND